MTIQDLINKGNDVMSAHDMEKYSLKTFMNESVPPYVSEFRSPCWLIEDIDGDGGDKQVKVTCLPAVFLGKGNNKKHPNEIEY